MSENWKSKVLLWTKLISLVYLLLLSVSLIGSSFKMIASEDVLKLFEFASNPIAGLVIGLVATAIIQSSSTVSSIIVGLVAGGLPIEIAIPMIMGSNIGTTVTNTFVSLGYIKSKEEFKLAFKGATIHDFFNLLAVLIFLPLEIMFGFLEKISNLMVSPLNTIGDLSFTGVSIISPVKSIIIDLTKSIFSSLNNNAIGFLLIALGVLTIILVVTFIGKVMKKAMVGQAKDVLVGAIGKSAPRGIASGALTTVLVQSSSTTTSLTVPLIGSKIISIKEAYPFILGSNIGTCITALLSATASSGEFREFALQIAIVHLMFNIFATILIYGIPFLRNIPLLCSEYLSKLALKNKSFAFLYLLIIFIITPSVLLYFTL